MPMTKQGKCPWCEKHNKTLFFSIGIMDGRLWCNWICAKCLSIARGLEYGGDTE